MLRRIKKNNFVGYNYRSCEDIFEAVKPLLEETNTILKVSDELIVLGTNNPTILSTEKEDRNGEIMKVESAVGMQRFYIKATATLIDIDDESKMIENTAYAREEETKKGMDGSQVTGATSSYARKYALNGLFLIDDVKDTDSEEYQKQSKKETKKIEEKKISDEKLALLANLDRPLKDKLVGHYKKDLTQFTEIEAIQSIESLKKKGLLK